jgi:transglutaminase-like putative cysteine protease
MAAPRKPRAVEREPLAPLAWTSAALGGGLLLHIDRVPAWTALLALLLIAWRLTSARTGAWLPGTALRALAALLLVALVLLRFHTLNGLAAGSALLMLMAAMKLLETRTRRDQFVIIGAGLFLLVAACLDRQDLARVPLYALQVWLCCAALAVVASPGFSARAAFALAARALLTALPVAVLLFVFFPRLSGSFWSVPRGEQARTGLSDTMTPGSIMRLIANYDPAFRVQFQGAAPPPEERYWRGPVLHDFDGRTWTRAALQLHRERLQYLGTQYRYRVSLEPTGQRWWFALDTPAQSPDDNVALRYDYQLLAAAPVNEAVSYEALSYTHTRAMAPLGAAGRRQDTALPEASNPRARALAQTLRDSAGSDAAFVAATLDYLRTGGFAYSLTPELLGADAVDDLLFNTHAGFCGHYASAFVTLMRAARVPARVVTGYLGGEWNPIGGFFVVRESDAHAWAEVWLEGRGWTRVDPTAVVAPERLRRGILDLLPDALSAPERLLHAAPWVGRVWQGWDAARAWWSDHVVKFDYGAQLDLLSRLGIRAPDVRYLGWGFTLALLGWLVLIAWHIGRGAPGPRPDALARAYLRLCRKLERAGTKRAPHQGPLSFADTVCERRPDLAHAVRTLLARYAQLRYGPPAPERSAAQVEEFRRAVAHLALPRRAARVRST